MPSEEFVEQYLERRRKREEMKAAVEQQRAAEKVAGDTSFARSATYGAIKGATLGFSDEGYGAIKGAWRSATDEEDDDWESFLGKYRTARDEYRGDEAVAQAAHPYAFGAGELAGGVASLAATGGTGAVVKGAGALAKAAPYARAMAQGGAMALGNTGADLTKGEYGRAALDTAVGAATGAVAHGAGSAMQRAGQKLRVISRPEIPGRPPITKEVPRNAGFGRAPKYKGVGPKKPATRTVTVDPGVPRVPGGKLWEWSDDALNAGAEANLAARLGKLQSAASGAAQIPQANRVARAMQGIAGLSRVIPSAKSAVAGVAPPAARAAGWTLRALGSGASLNRLEKYAANKFGPLLAQRAVRAVRIGGADELFAEELRKDPELSDLFEAAVAEARAQR